MRKLISILLVVSLIGLTAIAETADGFIDSQPIATETATDITLPEEGDSASATATTKTTDFVCVLKITEPNIFTIVSVDLLFATPTFHSCAPYGNFEHPDKIEFENLTTVNYNYRMRASFTGSILPQNTYLLEYRFSTTGAFISSANSIYDFSGVAIKYGDIENEYTNFAQKIVVQIGDVNGDGTVTSTDALQVTQYVDGSITLTENQRIAADANRNGVVDMQDYLMILQYTSSAISSFWFDKTITKAENTAIDTTKDYYLRNIDAQSYLSEGVPGFCLFGDYDIYDEDDCIFNFTHIGNGQYKISRYDDPDTVLYLKPDKTLGFTDISTTNRYKWYLVGSGSTFRLVNYIAQQESISYSKNGQPGSSYNQYGMLWTIQEHIPRVWIDTYFDYGYAIRYGNNNNATTQQEITALTEFVNQKLYAQFGIVLGEMPQGRIESYGDRCYGINNITLAKIEQGCLHQTTECDVDFLCEHALQDLPATQCSSTCLDRYHHNCPDKIFSYFQTNQTRSEPYISALFSGYNRCADTEGGGSMAWQHDCLMMNLTWQRWEEQTEIQMKQFDYLHEIGHCFGAQGDENCTTSSCIMSYNYHLNLDDIKKIFNSGKNAFCTQCENQINTNLSTVV